MVIFDNEPEPKRVALRTILDREKKNKEQVIKDLAAELDALTIPLENRIKPQVIDSLLKIELKKRGILLDFNLVIKNNKEHKVFFTSVNDGIDAKDDYYSAVLFENVGNEEAPYINIAFPEKQQMISDAMGPVLGTSLFLLLMLLTAFAYTIQAILKQKKLSDLKNDFINNMTHEFKTPVSTILLASEALKDPSVVKDEPRVHRLASIIYDENLRLGEHVERVLNMARMDKGEIKLAMNAVSLHNVINDVLKHMELPLANKNQEIVLNLHATNDSVYADAFHLKNIVQNLIDNASKYSTINSRVFIETEMQNGFVKLKVRDQGIGMKKDQVKKIFEPFYRVPTGNLHDVKGFGIGLHYVYSILKAMGGKISVKSEIGLGSEFSILLPKEL
jgi:two-component system, OmpR family, phosphate regulon sensor histidine kinase PhoR